jgi:hypothetical protein
MTRSLSALAFLLALPAFLEAGAPGPPNPVVMAVPAASVVVIGQIDEIEKKTVLASVEADPMSPKIEYQMATIKISDALLGLKGDKTVRIGVPVLTERDAKRYNLPPKLVLKKDVCLCLNPHHSGDFYILTTMSAMFDVKAKGFERDLETIKKYTSVYRDPIKALKVENQHDRARAVSLLLDRCNSERFNFKGARIAKVNVSREENELMITAISEAPFEYPNEVREKINPPPTMLDLAVKLQYHVRDLGFRLPDDPYPRSVPIKEESLEAREKKIAEWKKEIFESTKKFLKDNGDKIQFKKLPD